MAGAVQRYSGAVYLGRRVSVEEALSMMHSILDPSYGGRANEYVPNAGGLGATHVGTYGSEGIFFCEAPPCYRYHDLTETSKARLDEKMGNGKGK